MLRDSEILLGFSQPLVWQLKCRSEIKEQKMRLNNRVENHVVLCLNASFGFKYVLKAFQVNSEYENEGEEQTSNKTLYVVRVSECFISLSPTSENRL